MIENGRFIQSALKMRAMFKRVDRLYNDRAPAGGMPGILPMKDTLKIMIVAGEASGDSHAARLIRSLKKSYPDKNFDFFGCAGEHMRAEGVRGVVEAEGLAIIGGLEIARELPMFIGAFRRLRKAAAAERPDAAVLVDFPDFNLRLARSLRRMGIPVIYYISPQVWAWKKYRVRAIRRNVDLLLSILPFEKDFYASNGFDRVEYVGNPIADEVGPSVSREEFCRRHSIDAEKPIISLLHGSRRVEMKYILPDLVRTAFEMNRVDPNVQFIVPLAPSRTVDEVRKTLEESGISPDKALELISVVSNETYDALNASDAAAVASGTATLEAAVIGTPLAVVYKASRLNYRLLRPLISIDTFGLVNLVAGKVVAKELIQDDFTPQVLSEELFRLLQPDLNSKKREELSAVRDELRSADASVSAAKAVFTVASGGKG